MTELEAHDPSNPRHVMLQHFKEAVLDALDKARKMEAFHQLDGIGQAEVIADGSVLGAFLALAMSKEEKVPDVITELMISRLPDLVNAANEMFEGSVERVH